MPAFLPLDTICHHVGTPLLSGDSFGVRHAHPLQETQGGVSSHWVVLLIACIGRKKKKHTRSIWAMCGGIKWILISKQSTKLQTVSLIGPHTHTHRLRLERMLRKSCALLLTSRQTAQFYIHFNICVHKHTILKEGIDKNSSRRADPRSQLLTRQTAWVCVCVHTCLILCVYVWLEKWACRCSFVSARERGTRVEREKRDRSRERGEEGERRETEREREERGERGRVCIMVWKWKSGLCETVHVSVRARVRVYVCLSVNGIQAE